MNATNGDPLPHGKAEEVGMSSERLGEIEKVIKADIEKGRLPGAMIAIAAGASSSTTRRSASATRRPACR